MRKQVFGVVAGVAYVGTVVVANWAVQHYGVVPVGFGLRAPAGVYAVGVAFTQRDILQEAWSRPGDDRAGRVAVLVAIGAGAAVSALVSPSLAVASASAFLASELADFTVYTPLRRRRWLAAVVASNVVGILVDSVIFLWLAFRSLEFFPGQVVGKAWMTALAVGVLVLARRRYRGPDAVLPRHP